MPKALEPQSWTEGRWKGLPHYQCNACPYDTLHLEIIQSHIADRHTERTTRSPVTAPLVDRFGNQITEMEVSHGQADSDEDDGSGGLRG